MSSVVLRSVVGLFPVGVFACGGAASEGVDAETAVSEEALSLSSVLQPGAQLAAGDSLRSSDGRYVLSMQRDGNLVLYGPDGRALFDTRSRGAANGEVFAMGSDGNAVLWGPDGRGGGRPVWSTGTNRPGASLKMQNDGNLVVYSGTTPLWWTNTYNYARGCYRVPSGKSYFSNGSGQSCELAAFQMPYSCDGAINASTLRGEPSTGGDRVDGVCGWPYRVPAGFADGVGSVGQTLDRRLKRRRRPFVGGLGGRVFHGRATLNGDREDGGGDSRDNRT